MRSPPCPTPPRPPFACAVTTPTPPAPPVDVANPPKVLVPPPAPVVGAAEPELPAPPPAPHNSITTYTKFDGTVHVVVAVPVRTALSTTFVAEGVATFTHTPFIEKHPPPVRFTPPVLYIVEVPAVKLATPPTESGDPGVVVPMPTYPAPVIVVEPVAPKIALFAERFPTKNVVDVAPVIMSEPMVALFANKFPAVNAVDDAYGNCEAATVDDEKKTPCVKIEDDVAAVDVPKVFALENKALVEFR